MPRVQRGRRDYYEEGSWNVQCSMCGRKRKANEVVRNWQGLYRCPEHNEERHPQDFVRAIPDTQNPPFVQSQTQAFIGVCDPNSISAYIDYACADCVIVDYISPAFNYDLAPGE